MDSPIPHLPSSSLSQGHMTSADSAPYTMNAQAEVFVEGNIGKYRV